MQSIKCYIYIYIHFTELHWVAHGKKKSLFENLAKNTSTADIIKSY